MFLIEILSESESALQVKYAYTFKEFDSGFLVVMAAPEVQLLSLLSVCSLIAVMDKAGDC